MGDTPRHPWETQLRDAAARAEEDLKKLVGYINDEVVPDVRRNGSVALRAAAAELHKLAQRMDAAQTDARSTNPPPPVPRQK